MIQPAITSQARRNPTSAPSPSTRRPAIAGGVFRDGLLANAAAAASVVGERPDRDIGCVELLNITRPKLVAEMHRRLLRTGADMLFTNSSGAAPQILDRYRMHDEAFAVSYLGAEIATSTAREFSSDSSRPRVIGDVRMPWHMPEHGFLTGSEVETAVASMTSAQIAGGVDAVRLQISQLPAHMVAAFNGARAGMAEAGRAVPIMVSVRRDITGMPIAVEDSAPDLAASAALAGSFGAAALSIDGLSPGNGEIIALIDIAETIEIPLFMAPGAPESVIRHCMAHPAISRRLAFVGVEKPAHAWRLSRFTPARTRVASLNLQAGNDNGESLSTPRTPRIGAAR